MKMEIYDIIKKPLVTEKCNNIERLGKYTFITSSGSSKLQIKKAIEAIFKITIKSVNIINVHAKAKVYKGRKGVRSGFKKAIVTTKNAEKIEYLRRGHSK